MRKQKTRNPKPIIWVFCEGKTEEQYVKFLTNKFKISTQICISGNGVDERAINSRLPAKNKRNSNDEIILIYDADDNNVVNRINNLNIGNIATKIFSDPCVELWFLLHYKDQTAVINSSDCLKKLENNCKYYKKGELSKKLQSTLANYNQAYNRAKKLNADNNPSTTMYKLIDIFKKLTKT